MLSLSCREHAVNAHDRTNGKEPAGTCHENSRKAVPTRIPRRQQEHAGRLPGQRQAAQHRIRSSTHGATLPASGRQFRSAAPAFPYSCPAAFPACQPAHDFRFSPSDRPGIEVPAFPARQFQPPATPVRRFRSRAFPARQPQAVAIVTCGSAPGNRSPRRSCSQHSPSRQRPPRANPHAPRRTPQAR